MLRYIICSLLLFKNITIEKRLMICQSDSPTQNVIDESQKWLSSFCRRWNTCCSRCFTYYESCPRNRHLVLLWSGFDSLCFSIDDFFIFLQKIREIQRCLDREPLVKVRNPSTVIKDYKVRFSLLIQTLFNSVSILLKQFLNDVHFMMRMNEVNRIDFRHSYFQFLRLEVGLRAQSAKMGSSPWWRVVVSLCQ